MRFQDRVAIVTGGADGIGKEIARKMLTEGATVIITDINETSCEETVKEFQVDGFNAHSMPADVSQKSEVIAVVQQTKEQFGKIDILVNNAGIVRDARITEMEEEDWDLVINVCLKGSFLFAKYTAEYMISQEYGKIVNITSRAYLGNPGQANYSSAKSGVLGLTKALSKELGKHNITVNAVAPGLIETNALRDHPKCEKIKELQKRDSPIKRVGSTEDVANAVMFFASDDSSYITGDILHVTGGRFG
ncbi:NAD(P)-dependent oxidoreductase [Sporosarcina sp. P21c]|uniref:SDR family NAD(P)-dependent oxidoreductase n=1 Tax=Sporosarcina TaxID=1569 RepID=UPI000A164E8A|nr:MULTISPECIES: SDR family NAD(P)-dependent oxidoreductase [Sporosarcina]ARJ37917.1 beta-ketoacyl-ACP reductase [Sporosarcina ureae]PIC67768.1 NAD(P)-dependent oxidoreductase [Sporosarcina sp. P16a]PIC83761.1 NAD(P)-dependent oxidoreductase [Sporosarcina sp. P1]PIC90627.1 NAD(P)-dependent oxidoreductase [Sporosarcina sp. P21c]PIC93393.1 NAD(P)-dependent oxidoreductase [Sporosarcina sp. P25]